MKILTITILIVLAVSSTASLRPIRNEYEINKYDITYQMRKMSDSLDIENRILLESINAKIKGNDSILLAKRKKIKEKDDTIKKLTTKINKLNEELINHAHHHDSIIVVWESKSEQGNGND